VIRREGMIILFIEVLGYFPPAVIMRIDYIGLLRGRYYAALRDDPDNEANDLWRTQSEYPKSASAIGFEPRLLH